MCGRQDRARAEAPAIRRLSRLTATVLPFNPRLDLLAGASRRMLFFALARNVIAVAIDRDHPISRFVLPSARSVAIIRREDR